MLEVGINSYITLKEANEYFNTRLNNEAWLSLDENKKIASLIQASQIIDSKNFIGQKADSSQLLKFPRKNVIYDGAILPSNEVPRAIKQAVCELAIHLISNDVTAPNDLGQFEKVKLGPLEIQTQDNLSQNNIIQTLPPLVDALLKAFTYTQTRLYHG